MATRVKICGITRLSDARVAVSLGADALGFNFWPGSRRYISPRAAARIVRALPPRVTAVGVFVNASRREVLAAVAQSGVGVVQLHGDETPDFCERLPLPVIKAIRVEGAHSLAAAHRFRTAAVLLDAPSGGYGGSGRTFDWRLLSRARWSSPVVLAGGLTPDNVARAVRRARPFAVDVASGVERAPGRKSRRAMARFLSAAKAAPAPEGRST